MAHQSATNLAPKEPQPQSNESSIGRASPRALDNTLAAVLRATAQNHPMRNRLASCSHSRYHGDAGKESTSTMSLSCLKHLASS